MKLADSKTTCICYLAIIFLALICVFLKCILDAESDSRRNENEFGTTNEDEFGSFCAT